MIVLVTGCFGFVGSHVISELLELNYEVIGIDNLTNTSIQPTDRVKAEVGPEKWKRFKFHNADILDLKHISSIAIAEHPTKIIHLAAIGSVPRSFTQPSRYFENNVQGFLNMITVARGMKCDKFVFASSSAVYGDGPNPRTPGKEGKCLSPYALTKHNNEELARMLLDPQETQWASVRPFNVYGEGQRFDSTYSAVIPKFATNEAIKIYGDGNQVRDFTYVKDIARLFRMAMESAKPTLIINGCTGKAVKVKDLAEKINALRTEKAVIKNYPVRQGDVTESIGSVKNEIDWEPKTSLDEGLKKTVDYYAALQKQN